MALTRFLHRQTVFADTDPSGNQTLNGLVDAINTGGAGGLPAEIAARIAADLLLAPLASPALTGNPTVPTQAATDVSTRAASTAYVGAYLAANGYAPAGAPVISSVAGRTGVVVLSAGDIGGLSAAVVAASPVASFNSRTGPIVLASADVTNALTYTPYSAANPSGYIAAAGAPVQSVAGRAGAVALTNADIAGSAPIASPTFTGTVTIPAGAAIAGYATAAAVPAASNALPLANSMAIAGVGTAYARSDHVHPSDASRAALASPALTGVPTAPTAGPGTKSLQLATTAFTIAAQELRLDVRWYGAKCDGATDDTAAVQACYTAAIAAGCGVYHPPGVCLLSATIAVTLAANHSFSIVGAGQGLTQLRWSTANGLAITYASNSQFTNSMSSLVVQGLSLVTSMASGGTALAINGSFLSGGQVLPTTVRDVSITGTNINFAQWTVGILFNQVPQTCVENVLFCGTYATYTATGLQYSGAAGGTATVHVIAGFNLYFANYGILLNSYIQGMEISATNLTEVNYGIAGLGVLVAGAPNIQQVSATMSQIAAHVAAVQLSAAVDCSFIGNFLFLLGTTANTAVIALDSVWRCQVVGNDIVGTSSTGQCGVNVGNSLGLAGALNVALPTIVEANTFASLDFGVALAAAASGVTVGTNAYGGMLTASIQDNGLNNVVPVPPGVWNRARNGWAEVAQRGNGPWTANASYTADGWIASVSGGTLSTSIVSNITYGPTRRQLSCAAVLAVAATVSFIQRIESVDAADLVGKRVTVSFYGAASTTAGTFQAAIFLQSPNAIDNFAALTLIAAVNVTLTATPGRVWATFGPLPVGVANGLNVALVVTQQTAAGTVTFIASGLQIDYGSSPTALQKRRFDDELAACERHYQIGNAFMAGYAVATTGVGVTAALGVTMRAQPTVTIGTPSVSTNLTAPAVNAIGPAAVAPFGTVTATGAYQLTTPYVATAEL